MIKKILAILTLLISATVFAGTLFNPTKTDVGIGAISNVKATIPSSGTLQILTPVDVTSSAQTMQPNTAYYADDGSTNITFTMPSVCPLGSQIKIIGVGSGGYSVSPASGGTINASGIVITGGITTQIGSSAGNILTIWCYSNTFSFAEAIGQFTGINP